MRRYMAPNKLLLSASLCKQFGTRSGPTFVSPDLDPNCFVTLIVFLKEFFKKFKDDNKNSAFSQNIVLV